MFGPRGRKGRWVDSVERRRWDGDVGWGVSSKPINKPDELYPTARPSNSTIIRPWRKVTSRESKPRVGRANRFQQCRKKTPRKDESGAWKCRNPSVKNNPNPRIPVLSGWRYRATRERLGRVVEVWLLCRTVFRTKVAKQCRGKSPRGIKSCCVKTGDPTEGNPKCREFCRCRKGAIK